MKENVEIKEDGSKRVTLTPETVTEDDSLRQTLIDDLLDKYDIEPGSQLVFTADMGTRVYTITRCDGSFTIKWQFV